MIRKLLASLLTLMFLICAIPLAVTAEIPSPTSLGAPEHFGVSHYNGSSLYFTFSAPEDLRTYIENRAADDPENKQTFTAYFQIDYKIDGGSWHHTPEWDSPKTAPRSISSIYYTFVNGKKYTDGTSFGLSSMFPEDEALQAFQDGGWDYLKSHSITFRVRFAISFDYKETFVLSPWSKEYTLSANVKADYNKLINHAPSVKSLELKAKPDGEPYFEIIVDKLPGEVADLNAMSGRNVRTEVWMRRGGDQDFKYIGYEWGGYDYMTIDASDYFSIDGSKESFDAADYEIKLRYGLDLRRYKQSGYADSSHAVDIYGPFSKAISHNMPAWSNASQWATEELKKANNEGLIPDVLKGADLTKPITREEFCELALLLYEKATGKSPAPVSPNPFTDTKNPQILKAFTLGITDGTSPTTFSPLVLITREQCATMLFRTIKAIHPGGDYSIAGVKDFPDQKDISAYAVEGAKYMSKLGIIRGDDNGNFMPKATTTAQAAAGYGMATREAAILMSVRTYDRVDDIKATSASVVGTWVLGTLSGGKFNATTGKYEGDASGLGMIYTFKPDGTYTSLSIWSEAIWSTGRYSVKDGMLTLTGRTSETSNDDGKTWGTKETVPDSSAYFTTGTDESGKYLLIGEEGAAPPLVDKKNALKYGLKG